MPLLKEFNIKHPFGRHEKEIKDTLNVLFGPPEQDYRYEFPKNLSSRSELDKLKPFREWARESLDKGLDRTSWQGHGDGHIARTVVYAGLLLEIMKENGGVQLSNEQRAAIMLACVTHDLRYKSDKFEAVVPGKIIGHQSRASDRQWLRGIFVDLAEKGVSYFSEVEADKVIQLTSQINRVHDYGDDSEALATLKKDFPEANIKELPLELEIFKDIDAGLERLRTEEAYKRILNRVGLLPESFKKAILKQSWVEDSLRRFHFPHFEETRQLLPFAFHLYHLSMKNPEYKKDQWKITMDIAQTLGAITK